MSQISPKMRILAAAGLGLVVLAAGFKFLVLSHHSAAAAPPVPIAIHHTAVAKHSAPAKTVSHAMPAAAPKIKLDPSLPAPLRKALSHSRVVVAVLYAPDVPGDSDAVSEARKGAKAAHVGFTVLNVRNEAIARAVAAEVQGASDPAVLVVRRPGTVALKIDGFVDAAAVAQAAANTHP